MLTALVAYCARQADRQYTIGGKLDRIIAANANAGANADDTAA